MLNFIDKKENVKTKRYIQRYSKTQNDNVSTCLRNHSNHQICIFSGTLSLTRPSLGILVSVIGSRPWTAEPDRAQQVYPESFRCTGDWQNQWESERGHRPEKAGRPRTVARSMQAGGTPSAR